VLLSQIYIYLLTVQTGRSFFDQARPQSFQMYRWLYQIVSVDDESSGHSDSLQVLSIGSLYSSVPACERVCPRSLGTFMIIAGELRGEATC